jgi:hypothetical protein
MGHLIYYNKKRPKNILFTSVKKGSGAKSEGFARGLQGIKRI